VLASVAATLAIAICPPPGPVASIENVDAPAPEALIACVGTSPITGELFSHWLAISRKGSPGAPAQDLREQVIEFLVNAKWIEGETAERGIKVSDRAVRHLLTSQKHANFRTEREFRQFLEDSGMTRSDLKYRVRLDMLSERLRKDVVGKGSARTQARRFDRFVRRFQTKWTARTSCAAEYASERCGSTLAPPPPPPEG
jgi:SurA N-terminal domain